MRCPQNTYILQKGINSTLDSKSDKNTKYFLYKSTKVLPNVLFDKCTLTKQLLINLEAA